MVNPELVKQLLKELEAEKGSPVQLRADTPHSERYADGQQIDGREYFGLFSERGVILRPVDGLDEKYLADVQLIEGEYTSLGELQRRIADYNVLYGSPMPDTPVGRAFDLVQEATGEKLVINGLAWNFGRGNVTQGNVEKILQENGIQYFQHNIRARADGVYDDRTSGGTLSVVDETKVADITLKLIE